MTCVSLKLQTTFLEYSRHVLASVKYQPDPAWTLDIGEIDGGRPDRADLSPVLGVIEVGSFSCASFYAADPEPIIMAVGELFK